LPAAKLIRQHDGGMADIQNVPLVVDLDGTVVHTDLMWDSFALLLRRNPFAIFQILYWWSRGRALLKQKLAARVQVDPAALPYHLQFLEWLRREKKSGRRIVLATASDLNMARPVFDHLGLFDEILASDGKTNLRRDAKRQALANKFGEHGFDYAGNSADDLFVWRSARKAIVVNASATVVHEAGKIATLGPTFCEGYSVHEVGRRFLTELFWRSGFLAAVAAGLLLAMAFPKFSIAGLAWIAPGLMLAAAHGKSGRENFWIGCIAGLAFWLTSLYWLLLMPAPVYSVALAWLALSGFMACFLGIWTWLVARPNEMRIHGLLDSWIGGGAKSSSHTAIPTSTTPSDPPDSWAGRTAWALTGAAAWVALEMVRARILGGFPWSFLGVSQYQLVPLIQLAAFTGVYGVSFLVAWFSLALYSAARMLIQQPSRRHVWQAEMALPLIAVLACYIGGYFAANTGERAEQFLRATAIQPSVPQTLIWDAREDARRFQALLDLSQRALDKETNGSDLLVWPESAVPDIDDPTYLAINHFVQSNHIWLILNGEDVEVRTNATNYFNAAFIVGPDGRWRQAYHKRELVIFGEYVPLVQWLPFLKWLTPITGGWTPGDKPAIFELERRPGTEHVVEIQNPQAMTEPGASSVVKCAPLICFEDTFPGTARDSAQEGADFLVNLTNDGWFRQSAEQRQHMANAVFRAVENGLPLLRCANNGVTCLIDGHGRIEDLFRDAQDSEYGPGALTVEIPILAQGEKPASTYYNRHGDWFGWACVVVGTWMFISKVWGRKRTRA
jgi:apolipoprotein N-acyltransferase